MTAVAATTDALVARCIAGERQAWRELHQRYYATVYGFLRRLGVRPPDTEDACQEVFVQVFRYLATFQHRADLRTWLYKLSISQAARDRRGAVAGAAALYAALVPHPAFFAARPAAPAFAPPVHVAAGPARTAPPRAW